MDNQKDVPHQVCMGNRGLQRGGTYDGLYGLGFIGAFIYYVQHATSFGAGVIGFFKALVWPGFLIYQLLDYLKM